MKFHNFAYNFQRAALLESLSQVQASPNEVSQMTTISAMQTLGLRKLNEFSFDAPMEQSETTEKKFSSIAGRLFILKLCLTNVNKLYFNN